MEDRRRGGGGGSLGGLGAFEWNLVRTLEGILAW